MVVAVRRALMAYDDGRDADADAIFTEALQRWSGAPSILQARAAVRLAQGRALEALRDAQAAVTVDDAAESYANVVLAALEAGGDLACARRYAEAYLSCPRTPSDRRQRQFDERTRARYLR